MPEILSKILAAYNKSFSKHKLNSAKVLSLIDENKSKGIKAKQGSSFLPHIVNTEMKTDVKNIIANSVIVPLQRNGNAGVRFMEDASEINTKTSVATEMANHIEIKARETKEKSSQESLGLNTLQHAEDINSTNNKFGAEFEFKKLQELETVVNKVMEKAQELLEKKSKLWFPASLESKFDFDYKRQIVEFESQSMMFSASGTLTNEGGNQVKFQIGFAISREFYSEISTMGGFINNNDRLALSFNEKSSQLTDLIFSFDISKTQPEESIGNGFLIVDRSDDLSGSNNIKDSGNALKGKLFGKDKSQAYLEVEAKAGELMSLIGLNRMNESKQNGVSNNSAEEVKHIDFTV